MEKEKTEIDDYGEDDNNQAVVISVMDTELLSRLFTRFAPGKSNTSTISDLFISRRIVEGDYGRVMG